jgi:hypothetical protein
MFTTHPPFAEYELLAALFKIGNPETDFGHVVPTKISIQARNFLLRCFTRCVVSASLRDLLVLTYVFLQRPARAARGCRVTGTSLSTVVR